MLLPGKLYAEAKKAADRRNISLAGLVRMALTEWLDESGDPEAKDKTIDEIFDSLNGDIVRSGELNV